MLHIAGRAGEKINNWYHQEDGLMNGIKNKCDPGAIYDCRYKLKKMLGQEQGKTFWTRQWKLLWSLLHMQHGA